MGFIGGFILGAIFGACLGAVVMGLMAGGKIQDILADMAKTRERKK